MDTSALYSDIVLPAATWYEKDDLNTTDLHSYINPMQAAVAPAWESRSDWDIYKAVAKQVSELAKTHLPEPVRDVVMLPLQHDTPDELAQPRSSIGNAGTSMRSPAERCRSSGSSTRDYAHLYEQMVSPGAQGGRERRFRPRPDHPGRGRVRAAGAAPAVAGKRQPRAAAPGSAREVAEAILALDPASNGELAHRAFEAEEHKTGVALTYLAAGQRDVRISFSDIVSQPRRVLTTPTWSAIVNQGRAYAPFTLNVERLIPWRTLTGRQHFYLDHENYLAWGEHLPTYKPRPDHTMLDETQLTLSRMGRVGASCST